MSVDSKIEWTDHTFNPWWGCTKVSPGCDHCYAETFAKRVGQQVWGKDAPRRQMSDKHWAEPLKWDRAAAKAGVRRRVFCASMADVFEGRPDQQSNRLRLWALIRSTPNLDWLLLTKRPGAILPLLEDDTEAAAMAADHDVAGFLFGWIHRSGNNTPHNIWLGTTVEDQKRADERIARLTEVPAVVRFLSCEPLLEPVDLAYAAFNGADSFGTTPGIHWVIVGGESGHGARPFDIAWARDIQAQCEHAGVAFFFKQAGGRPVGEGWGSRIRESHPTRRDVVVLNDRKGGDLSEIPADLRVREFPKGGDR